MSFFEETKILNLEKRCRYIRGGNIIGSAVLIVLCFVLIAQLSANVKIIERRSIRNHKSYAQVPVVKIIKKPLKFYTRVLERQGVFVAQSGGAQSVPSSTEAQVLPQVKVSELELVGVMSGPSGLQAIIRNAKTDQSYYCYGGDDVEGYLVKEVMADKVVLESNEQELELKL